MTNEKPERQRGNEIGQTTKIVAENISRTRKNASMTLEMLSERLTERGWPLSVAALYRLETGERRIDVDDITALAAVLNTSPAVLLNPGGTQLTGLIEALLPEEIAAWLSGTTKIDDRSLQSFWERDLKTTESRLSESTTKAFVVDSESHKKILERNIEFLERRKELALKRILELQERTGTEVEILGSIFPPFDPLEQL